MFNRQVIAVVIIILAAALGYFVYASAQFKLGLDLKGGSHLVYEADTSKLPSGDVGEAMSSLREVIERRINVFGVSEPVIQVERSGLGASAANRLIVELPGVTDIKQAEAVIDVTPVLEFKTERPDGPEKEKILAAIKDYQENQKVSPLLAEDPYFVSTGLDGRFLKRAEVQFTQNNLGPSISIEFNGDGAKRFADLTKNNIEKRIGIYLDNQLLSAPTVRTEIPDGRAEITGQFTIDEAKTLVRNLNLGALPVPIRLIASETIGATLGGEALDKGLKAGVIGFAVVALFMLLWYRLPGIVAVVSLSIYIILMLAIFKFLPVVLTAAGMAGFILSVGMAVDANILIFERIKEELRKTDNMHEAIHHGFSRAWLSIRDSNLSSIISALILFWFGTSLIKGFALTLAIGVLVSMFTAITITRTFLLALGVTHQNRLTRFLFSSGLK
ncbi:MAG: protein translocase subunit SecD [Candidatus Vogelbacteria bacterium]|nr:protein translocase subunit SecD [Candidatus Vogelbacteria bacterium]